MSLATPMVISCRCGAQMAYSSTYAPHVHEQRAAFEETHAACREAWVKSTQPPPPGPCFHDPGLTWPTGVSPRCELRAGHAGAHECDRGSMGGTAVWTDEASPATTHRPETTTDAREANPHG